MVRSKQGLLQSLQNQGDDSRNNIKSTRASCLKFKVAMYRASRTILIAIVNNAGLRDEKSNCQSTVKVIIAVV